MSDVHKDILYSVFVIVEMLLFMMEKRMRWSAQVEIENF